MKKLIIFTIFALLTVFILLLVWGILIEPRFFDTEEETAEIPQLPARWEGKQIALIADMQVGMWFNNTDTISDIVQEIVEKRPGVVLIAGDFIYRPTEDEPLPEALEESQENREEFLMEIRRVVKLLHPLAEAKIPVYAVLGNHDYAMEKPNSVKLEWVAREVESALEANGITVLKNEALPLKQVDTITNSNESENLPLYVVGIGSHYAENSHPKAAVDGVPPEVPRIVFMHNPDSFAELPPGTAPFAVAAHTHGGQVRLPLMPDWSWMSYKVKGDAHADGWIDNFGQPGNRLYVNRGIGFSLYPIRINCFPELTLFTLQRKAE